MYGAAGGLTGWAVSCSARGAGGVGGSAEEFDEFGRALSAGDFNNDGFADLAVEVPFEAIGAIPDAGAVNVLYGGAGGAGPAARRSWQAAGGVPGNLGDFDRFGWALAAGDFPATASRTWRSVFRARTIGPPRLRWGGQRALRLSDGLDHGSQLWDQDTAGIEGAAEANDLFGYALATGDFDNDGFDDLAWVCRARTSVLRPQGGQRAVRLGRPGATAGDQLWCGQPGMQGIP